MSAQKAHNANDAKSQKVNELSKMGLKKEKLKQKKRVISAPLVSFEQEEDTSMEEASNDVGSNPKSIVTSTATFPILPPFRFGGGVGGVQPPPPSLSSVSRSAIRAHMIEAASPFFRFRAFRSFMSRPALVHEKPLDAADHVAIMVRAIGEYHTMADDGEVALLGAFKSLGIKVPVIFRFDHTEWPGEWLVHVPCKHVHELPRWREISCKGVFCGVCPKGKVFSFIWTLVPNEAENYGEYFSDGYMRAMLAVPPVYALDPDSPPKVDNAVIVNGFGQADTPLPVRDVQHLAITGGNEVVLSGKFILYIHKHPSGAGVERIWTNASQKYLTVKWQGGTHRVHLMPTCTTCGFEDHTDAACIYASVLDVLRERRQYHASKGTLPHSKTIGFVNQKPQVQSGPSTSRQVPPRKFKSKGKAKA